MELSDRWPAGEEKQTPMFIELEKKIRREKKEEEEAATVT